ncbi:DNA polymerase delta subunit 3 [Pseudoliparis swirei]|uniref:DNA polymerase delta subunit 3 n=1 Tax=Pseudoliparis swirei TaxID=2059687 RepID=UPI0024BE3DE5|nr:DNA polymerase delta subunit 3 [Pseudoliparis swirei]
MDELYLDNIDEYVNDQDKIVTYKWLSLTLGVHVNTAKQMLFHYLDHKRKESSAQLNATYLVSGKFVDNGQSSHRVSVVKEDKLEDCKSKMSLVVSVHVYSVQKALLKDSGPLYGVDYDAVRDNLKDCGRHSAIRCAGATPVRPPAPETQRAATPEPRDNVAGVTREAGVAPKPAAKPQRGIMEMFASKPAPKNQDGGRDGKEGQKEEEPTVDAHKSKPDSKANLMNFFGSQAAKRAVKTDDAERQRPTTSTTREKPAAAVELQQDSEEESEKDSRTDSSRKDSSRKESSRTDSSRTDSSRSKTKRLVDSDSEEEKMEKKKRRRIKRPEPDSSDDDVIPDSPQPMETRDPSPKKKAEPVSRSHRGDSEMKTRKRRRVLKSRTFLDDEGSIVTEKSYESESYSEAEDDVQAVTPAPRNPAAGKLPAGPKPDDKRSHKKTSAAANKGTKQASIMGFFQKK